MLRLFNSKFLQASPNDIKQGRDCGYVKAPTKTYAAYLMFWIVAFARK